MEEIKGRREGTARELAEAQGVSIATVMRKTAESRADYLAKSRHRESVALELKDLGLTSKAIAELMETTVSSVNGLVKRARNRRGTVAVQPIEVGSSTPDSGEPSEEITQS